MTITSSASSGSGRALLRAILIGTALQLALVLAGGGWFGSRGRTR